MSIQNLAEVIRDQADRLFPDRTDSSMFLKLYHELGELISAESEKERADEFADVMILLLDYADRKGIRIEHAVRNKMQVNENRKWKVNAMGVNQHE